MRGRAVLLALIVLVAAPASTASGPVFAEDFEGALSAKWPTSKSGEIVPDPLRAGNQVVHFRSISSAGDIYSAPIRVSKSARYRLSFDFMGKRDSGGGIIGIALGTPGHHRWLAGILDKGAGEKNFLRVNGRWRTYNVYFRPGDHVWFTADGGSSEDPGTIRSLRIMVEQHLGEPGDAYFDNITLHRCTADGCGDKSDEEPVRVRVSFHANNLPTQPPNDGGQCPGDQQASRVTGQINAQITPGGDHQGSGDVDATPHRASCRVPTINVGVDRVRLKVIKPGKTLEATLSVRITSEGVHRSGDCRVGTKGTITAVYDVTKRARNSLQNDSVRIGPWQGACGAHQHFIHNNISSITADASSSTWVRVNIACLDNGYSPRNCEG